ncbi:MAG: DUF4397 domain-containing protein [Candidatus Baltobacteraceae bacterium]|jgi:hypothetical protein
MRSLLGWAAAIGLTGTAVLVGCSSGGSSLGAGSLPNNTTGGPTNNTGAVQYRVLNGSPDIGSVDVYVDGNRTIANLKYGQVGPGNWPFYANLQPSNHNVTICLASPGSGCSSASALSTATILSTSFRTTVVVVDKTAATSTLPAVLSPNALAFNEPFLSSPGTAATLVMHHAAPLTSGGILAFGTFIPVPLSQPSSTQPTITQLGLMNYSDPPLVNSMAVLSHFTLAAGTGLYVGPLNPPPPPPPSSPSPGPSGLPTPPAILYLNDPIRVFPTPLPSQLPVDVLGSLPFALPPSFPCPTPPAPCASLYQNLSVYAVDSIPTPGASPIPALVGIFDANN